MAEDNLRIPCIDLKKSKESQSEEITNFVSFGGGFVLLETEDFNHKDDILAQIPRSFSSIPSEYHDSLASGNLHTKNGELYKVPQVLLSPGTENLSYTIVPDHKYALDVNAKKMKGYIDGQTLEQILFSGNNTQLKHLWAKLTSVVKPILEFVSYGIGLTMNTESPRLLDIHETMKNNMRFIHYPESKEKGVSRCGAHKDFGTITLLCQDGLGGLEVLHKGKWKPITPHPDAYIFVNFGMCLEMIYGIPALVHRVVDPPQEFLGPVPGRNSAALFVDPDRGKLLKPLNTYVDFTREKLKHALKKSSHRKDKKSYQESIMSTFRIDMQEFIENESDTEERLDFAHRIQESSSAGAGEGS